MLQENRGSTSSTPSIPAEDVKRQYLLIEDEIHQAIDRVLPTGRYVLGTELAAFEQEFAAFCSSHLFLELGDDEVDRVAAAIQDFFGSLDYA
jgi:hypothetical protein